MKRFLFVSACLAASAVFADSVYKEVFSKSRFAATGNYAYPEDIAAWTEQTKQTQRAAGVQLLKEIREAAAAGQAVLTVAPGDYRFPESLAKEALTFLDVTNLTINGQGARLWFETVFPLTFQNCKNVAVRGFEVDCDPVSFAQGVIVAVDPAANYFVMRNIDGFADPQAHPNFKAFLPVFSADGVTNKFTLGFAKTIKPLGDDFYRITLNKASDYLAQVELLDVVCMTPRVNGHPFYMMNCGGMVLEDLTVYNAFGFAFLERQGDGGSVYRGIKIKRRPGTSRYMALNADGIHSSCMDKGPLIENCEIGHVWDDFVNVHGLFSMVCEIVDPQTVILGQLKHTTGSYVSGADLVFYRFEDMSEQARVKCVSAVEVNDPALKQVSLAMQKKSGVFMFKGDFRLVKVALDRPVETTMRAVVSSSGKAGRGFVIRNNYFHHNFARGIIIKGQDGLVENNRVVRSMKPAIAGMPEHYWMEGPALENVIIRGNRIEDCNLETSPDNQMVGAINLLFRFTFGLGDRTVYPAYLQRNITIADNTIVNTAGSGISVANSEDVTVEGNTIINPVCIPPNGNGEEFFGAEIDSAIYLAGARDVHISGNVIQKSEYTKEAVGMGKHVDVQTIAVMDNTVN